MPDTSPPWRTCPDALLRPVRGVLTDIDDTLTTDGAISAQALQALADLHAAGLPVIAITGRPMGWSRPFAQAWPLAAIVAENGAVALINTPDGVLTEYAQDEATRRVNAARLQGVAARILREVPGATLARDSAGRVTDIAIDHSKFSTLAPEAITQVVALMQAEGMAATVSSIHINGWFGHHDKPSGARWMLQRLLGLHFDDEPGRWLYVGDSTNDQGMFAQCPLERGRGQPAALCRSAAHLACLDHRGRARRGLCRGGRAPAGGAGRAGGGMNPGPQADQDRGLLGAALALALAAAVSLGLSRFSYALLLPPMRADLGWSYFTAGLMNTVNAAGYLAGALLAPRALATIDARRLLLAGGAAAALLLAAHGLTSHEGVLLVLRALTGMASAASFVSGGLLAARLASAGGGARHSWPGAGPVLRWHRLGHRGLGLAGATADGGCCGPCLAARLVGARRAGGRIHPHHGPRHPQPACATRGQCAAGALPGAAHGPGAGRLPDVRPGLHRLHDLHRHPAARAGPGRAADRGLLHLARAAGWWPRPGCGRVCCSATVGVGRWRC